MALFVCYTSPMLYLIGGPPRMGKSSLAQEMLARKSIPYVSTDGLTVMLKPMGQPSFYDPEKSERFFPYLDLFISRITSVGPDYTIEGDAFLPKHVEILRNKYELRCVFLTMRNITKSSIISHVKHDDWTSHVSNDHLDGLVDRIKMASTQIADDCAKLNIASVDLSENYSESFEEAFEILIKP